MPDADNRPGWSAAANVFNHERYLVRRKVFNLFGASYHVYGPDGRLVLYSRQKAFKLKEDIRLYTGEDMLTEVLAIRARQVVDFSAAYDVTEPAGNTKVGALKRKGLRSILKDEWLILDAYDRETGFITEDSAGLALARRFLTNLIPQTFYGECRGQRVCEFKQNFNPFVLRLGLDFSMDRARLFDRRLGIAAAILLCAVEGRQR